jgi:16S rRNA (uracil1498-N3)-methyltransferase
MARFFAAPPQWNPDSVALDAWEARHACEVLRLKTGDLLEVFDGRGRRARGRLAQVTRQGAVVRIEEVWQASPPRCRLTLIQALPKGKLMEWIVEKATELGVSRIVPVVSDRCIVRVDPSEADRKREKWERVALEACKQCAQDWLPEVWRPLPLMEALRALDAHPGQMLLASLRPGATRLEREWSEFSRPDHALLVVGPEGDFTSHEYENLVQRGAREITLGGRILRVETAALSLVNLAAYALEV